MRQPRVDAELRRAMAELAALDPEDAAAILDSLDPRARRRASALLSGEFAFPVDRSSAGAEAEHFSDWLAQRVTGQSSMTETAQAALRQCAIEVVGAQRPVLTAMTVYRPSLLSRLASALGRATRHP